MPRCILVPPYLEPWACCYVTLNLRESPTNQMQQVQKSAPVRCKRRECQDLVTRKTGFQFRYSAMPLKVPDQMLQLVTVRYCNHDE
jgi:hypothetical protein